jgi:hypothetical protein
MRQHHLAASKPADHGRSLVPRGFLLAFNDYAQPLKRADQFILQDCVEYILEGMKLRGRT